MDSMYRIRDMLCKELDNIARDGSLTNDRLNTIDKLTHSIKSIDTSLAMRESGYSSRYDGSSYGNERYHDDYSRRYRDGGYSRTGDIRERLMNMLNTTSDSREREAIQKAIDMM